MREPDKRLGSEIQRGGGQAEGDQRFAERPTGKRDTVAFCL